MTTTLTPEAVAELLELEAKATSGDWSTEEEAAIDYRPTFIRNVDSRIASTYGGGPRIAVDKAGERRNANFIAAARNLIRPLAEAYQRQPDAIKAAQVEALRGMREWCLSRRVWSNLHSVSDEYSAGNVGCLENAIAEIDRRILALEKQP